MKHIIQLLFISFSIAIAAQNTTHKIEERIGYKINIQEDTSYINFNRKVEPYSHSNFNNYIGTLGTPFQSHIYYERTTRTPLMFADIYDGYIVKISDLLFNVNNPTQANISIRGTLPYSLLHPAEGKIYSDLSINIHPQITIGGLGKFIYSNGNNGQHYNHVGNGAAWIRLEYERYSATLGAITNNIANRPDRYNNRKNGTNYNHNIYYFNNIFHIGPAKRLGAIDLSLSSKWENANRAFHKNQSVDSIAFASLRNTAAIIFNREFYNQLPFSFNYYLEHEYRFHANLINKKLTRDKMNDHHLHTGFSIYDARTYNNGTFHYNIDGDVYVCGLLTSEFNITTNFKRIFNIKAESLLINWFAGFHRDSNTKFLTRYDSDFINWNNDFSKFHRTDMGLYISLPKHNISLGTRFDNINRMVYYNNESKPMQLDNNTQIVAVDFKANIKFWKFNIENQLVYQHSSNKEAIPLPDFSIYSNLYFNGKIKNLNIQPGISITYYTPYYANIYNPITGIFSTQNKIKIGNTPELSIYLNANYKSLSFFVEWSHFNAQMFGGTLYSSPNEIQNSSRLQCGIQWRI